MNNKEKKKEAKFCMIGFGQRQVLLRQLNYILYLFAFKRSLFSARIDKKAHLTTLNNVNPELSWIKI